MRPIDGEREGSNSIYPERERERERGGIERVMQEVDSYDPLTEVEIWGHTDESREGTVMERTQREKGCHENFLDEKPNCKLHYKISLETWP